MYDSAQVGEADDANEGTALDLRCSASELASSTPKRRLSTMSGGEFDDSDSEHLETVAGSEQISGELNFKPLYMV